MGAIEDNIQRSIFSNQTEKTFTDKLLARKEVERLRELIRKPRLKRSDILEILYLISGTESKLLNYGEWDRYVILKFFVWIREFVKVAESVYDYQEDLEAKSNTCRLCNHFIEAGKAPKGSIMCSCPNPVKYFTISLRTYKLLDNAARNIEHNTKFLVDLYLNIGRTSLSVGATGLMEFLNNRYEIYYPSEKNPTPQVQHGRGMFGLGGS